MKDRKESGEIKEQKKQIYAKIYEYFHAKIQAQRENNPQRKAVFTQRTAKGSSLKILDLEFLFQANGKIKVLSEKKTFASCAFLHMSTTLCSHFLAFIENAVFPREIADKPSIPHEIDLLIAPQIDRLIRKCDTAIAERRDMRRLTPDDLLLFDPVAVDNYVYQHIQCEAPDAQLLQFLKENPESRPPRAMVKHYAQNLARIEAFNSARGYVVHKLKGGGAFGMPVSRLARFAAAEFVRSLDPEILRLTWLSDASRHATITRYNQVISFLPLYRQVHHDAPRLLNLLDVTLNTMSRQARARWLRDPPFILHNLRQYWLDKGLSKAAWRLVSQSGITEMKSWMKWLREDRATFIFLANLCPPRQLSPTSTALCRLHYFTDRRDIQLNVFPQVVETFFRSYGAVRRGRTEKTKLQRAARLQRLDTEYSDLADYLLAIQDGHAPMPVIPHGAGLSWWTRRQQAWHVDVAIQNARRAKKRDKSWKSLVTEYRNDIFAAHALITSEDLLIEGYLMNHCVGGYDKICATGNVRIFSIRQGDERLATLELAFNSQSRKWVIAQLRGKCNCEVDHPILDFAHEVLDAYASAWSASKKKLAA